MTCLTVFGTLTLDLGIKNNVTMGTQLIIQNFLSQNLKPHWDKAASELKGKVKLGAVDATVHSGPNVLKLF